jgi:PKD repeat protein
MKNHIIFLLVIFSISMIQADAQYDTITVMYYNTLNYPDAGDPNRDDQFRTINRFLMADVILISELTSEAGAFTLLNDALNVYGTTHYQKAAFTDGPDTDNMLFYNSDKLVLHSQSVIPTALRHINEYVLFYKSSDLEQGGDTVFLYFYSAHLKAYPEDSLQRLAEVNAFRTRLDNLPGAENIFFGGDLNFYTNLEPAYEALINQGVYLLNDPLPAGEWHANYSYRFYHTQSTRTDDFGGGSIGGLDDRFDFILFSDDVLSGSNKVEYLPGSCEAFGNDGNHFNEALTELPLNPEIPDSVTNALYYMSDHLPVICKLKINAFTDTTQANLVITEIMYNPPEYGADSLEFIEIYNSGTDTVNMGGYYFASGINFTFPNFDLYPGNFTVVGIDDTAMLITFGINAFQWTSDGLNNNGELILLKDSFGNAIDSVYYDDSTPWPAAPDGDGPSLIICDPGIDNALGANWQGSQNFVTNNGNGFPVYATPGFSECGFPPLASFVADHITIIAGGQVHFTDQSANNPTGWYWSFEGGDPQTSSSQNPLVTYNIPGSFNVSLTVSNSFGSNSLIYQDFITVTSNNPVLIITEIMQNPASVADGTGEWFEIFNPTSTSIDLMDWYVKDNDDDSIKILSSVIIPAHDFATLGINNIISQNGNYLCNYKYADFFLSNSADEIILFNPSGEEIDRVEYDGGPAWPDPNGASMIFTGNISDDNNDFSNWAVSVVREPNYSGSLSDLGSPGTNGTGQNLVIPGFELELKIILEGAFSGVNMNTNLNSSGLIPLAQPYNTSPWNYPGIESVSSIPDTDVVDWVLIELRDASQPVLATGATVIGQAAAFLMNDGSVLHFSGNSRLFFNLPVNGNLYIIVKHRNHLEVMSNFPPVLNGNIYSYDFSTSVNQVYGGSDGHKELLPGVWGMYSGDSDGSGLIDVNDKSGNWQIWVGETTYSGSDMNLDAQTDNRDKNEFWVPNISKSSQVPD